jgi:t-SNARE complex subunit (syntaxin)
MCVSLLALRGLLTFPQDIVHINQTVMELQQLMNDMALMVEQDQNKINVIEKTAAQVRDDTERGFVPCLLGLNSGTDIDKPQ